MEGPVKIMKAPVRLEFEVSAGRALSRFLAALVEGRLFGMRCPECSKVYLPRSSCPRCGVALGEDVPVADTGTVTTFCVVNVGYPGQRVTPPYVAAAVLLDGADIAFQHLVLGCDPGEVRMGMRVRAVWGGSGRISHFAPAGEPDASYESYARCL